MENEQLNEMLASYEAEKDLFQKASIAHNITNYYLFNLNQNEEALKYAQIALKLVEDNNNEREICSYLISLGVIHKRLNQLDQAKEAYQRAIPIAEKLQDDHLTVLAYTNLAIALAKEQSYSLALDCLNKVLKTSEKLGVLTHRLRILITIGGIYHDTGDHKKAIQYHRQALRIQSPDDVQGFVSLMNLGLSYMALKEYALAIGYFKRSIPLLERVNHVNAIANVYCFIAEALIDLSKYDKATIYAHKAKNLVEEKNITDAGVKSKIYTVFMQLCFNSGNTEEMEQYIQKFIDLNITQPDLLRSYYSMVHNFYEQQQRYDLAYQNLKKYLEVNQQLIDEEIQMNLAVKTANLEYEREKLKTEILEQKNVDLESYQKIIEQKNAELIKLHESKDYLMNTISHDLKNYLGAIQQARDILVIKEQEMLRNKFMKIITSSTERSLNLVNDILYSTKLNVTNDSLSLQTVDINKVIAENEDSLLLRGTKKGIIVVFDYTDEPIWVEIDKEKWHRIFENLTTNAIKFTSARSEIRISTIKEGEFALISVKDSGIGIPPENLCKLFTPFSGVGRKGTEGEDSTGLGLSIVKKLVDLHGGTIEVTSEVGKGTEFIVKLKLIS